jgi:phage gp46-like protein
MILIVNGQRQDVSAPLDQLTRAVIISLFTWRRAEPDDNAENPMGWWGDTWPTVQNDRIGSRLYLLRRSKLTNQTPIKAREYIRQALQWLTDDEVAARIEIDVQRTGIDVLSAGVTIWQRDGTRHNITFDDFWSAFNG